LNLTPADRLFIGRFLLLFVATLVVALLGTFKAPLPALGDKNSHQQAYLFQQAKVLFSNDPTLSASDVLSLNAKKPWYFPIPGTRHNLHLKARAGIKSIFAWTPTNPFPTRYSCPGPS